MNWKNEAIERLNRYPAMVQAVENIPLELNRLRWDMESIKSIQPDRISSPGTSGPSDDKMINNIIKREELSRALESAKIWVETTDSAMNVLTQEEQTILQHMYIKPQRGVVNFLCSELGIEQSSVYRRRDAALYRFTMALYGAA